MLTGKQKRYLRSLGHSLKPVVMIGKNDIEDGVIKETDQALEHHELIKVKVLESSMLERNEAADALAAACAAEVAQLLGRTFLLYRQGQTPAIQLPRGK